MRRARSITTKKLIGICAVAALASGPAVAVPVTSPFLPPTEGQYVSITQWHAVYNTYGVQLSDPIHSGFTNIQRSTDPGFEQEIFNSTLTANTNLGPVTLTGPVTTRVFGYTSGQTGTFQTEIISMSLSGDAGPNHIDIRESPLLQSQGETTIIDLGGGVWEIDSFFDVWTELSINGGGWDDGEYPSGAPRLTFTPEPATMGFLALGGLLMIRRRR